METIYGVRGVSDIFKEKEQKGVASIIPYEFKGDIFYNLRAMRDGGHFFKIHDGNYVKLMVDGKVMMSDTGMERYSNSEFINEARGNVLIAGLGIGLIIKNIVSKKEVMSITVIEKYQDVIDLVAPKFKSNKLKIVCADIFEFKTKEKFDTIYFDIWPEICTDNLDEIKQLHNRFKFNKKPKAWMNSWLNEYLKTMRRKESRNKYW